MNEITDAFGYWFSGFTDGEGCFTIGKYHQENSRANYHCQFQISLRNDDKAILEEIRDTLKIGGISNKAVRNSDGHNRQPQTTFQVAPIKGCAMLVEVFSKYPLRAKKKRDFEVWKQAVAELQKPVKCRDADLLEYYFQKIREVRQYEKQDELPRPKKIELQLSIEF